MAAFVVDASLPLAWCFAKEATPFTRGVLDRLETAQALAPALWPLEVANVLALAQRSQRITAEGKEAFLFRLQALPIQIERRPALWLWQQILPLAHKHRLSYDAAYLELALREGLPLATLDGDLKTAAVAAGVLLLKAQS